MSFTKHRLLAACAGLIALAAVLYACKAPTVQAPSAVPPPQPITITSSFQAAQITSEVNQAKELVYNTAIVLKDLGNFAQDVIVSDPTVTRQRRRLPAADYGSYIYTGSVNASGQYSLTLTFSLCRMNGLQFDGAYTASGSGRQHAVLAHQHQGRPVQQYDLFGDHGNPVTGGAYVYLRRLYDALPTRPTT